jgi:hypothetical protein
VLTYVNCWTQIYFAYFFKFLNTIFDCKKSTPLCQDLIYSPTGETASPKFFKNRKKYGRRTLPDSSEGEGTYGTADFSEYSSRSTRTRSSRGHTSSRVSSFDVDEEVSGRLLQSKIYINNRATMLYLFSVYIYYTLDYIFN